MATRKTRVRNADVIPTVQTDVFDASPNSRFVVVAVGYGLCATPIYTSVLDLRTRVYTAQTGMLCLEELPYRVDIDDDDERSFTFAVLEKRGHEVVTEACVRVIERRVGDNRPLPVDELFGLDLGEGCVEVSRYIGRLPDPASQQKALYEMLRSTIAHIHHIGAHDHVYAIVEPALERVLRVMGVGVTRVGEPVWLDEYQGVNVAIKLDVIESAANLGGLDEIDTLDASEGAVRFWSEVK